MGRGRGERILARVGRRAAVLPAIVAGIAVAVAGCGGGGAGSGHRLRVATVETQLELDGQVAVQQISYAAAGGGRVPALFAAPRGVVPRGCLIWQDGLDSRTADTVKVWDGAARLGMAVLSVDLRGAGGDLATADPRSLAARVRRSVTDLGRAVAYLEQRRECRRNVGYGGTGVGGMLGALLAGRDTRVRATVLRSTPPTWASFLATGDGASAQPPASASDLAPLDPVRWAPRIAPRPVLVLIDRDDAQVPRAAATRMAAAVRSPRRVVTYHGKSSSPGGAARGDAAVSDFLLQWLVKPSYAS